MKIFFLTTLALMLILTNCFSQDVIIKNSGEDIHVKIIEVRQFEIIYKNFNNQNGPTFEILNLDVLMIKYENGAMDIFKNGKKLQLNNSTNKDSLVYTIKGEADVLKYYRKYRDAGMATFFISGFATPLIGLIPAIKCSSTPPKEKKLNWPNAELMKNSYYYNSYTKKAGEIKHKKIWNYWLLGLFANLGLTSAFIMSGGWGSY